MYVPTSTYDKVHELISQNKDIIIAKRQLRLLQIKIPNNSQREWQLWSILDSLTLW